MKLPWKNIEKYGKAGLGLALIGGGLFEPTPVVEGIGAYLILDAFGIL